MNSVYKLKCGVQRQEKLECCDPEQVYTGEEQRTGGWEGGGRSAVVTGASEDDRFWLEVEL